MFLCFTHIEWSKVVIYADAELSNLTAREERIIRLRCGIGGVDEHTLEQVGEILDISVKRVRQIENQAIRKMRQLNRSKNLRVFY